VLSINLVYHPYVSLAFLRRLTVPVSNGEGGKQATSNVLIIIIVMMMMDHGREVAALLLPRPVRARGQAQRELTA
jgi:hypothetical protein